MKTTNCNSVAENQLVSRQKAHDHGDDFEEPKIQLREIVVKKADSGSHTVNASRHEEPLSPVACLTLESSLDSYILTIVGFKKEIDVKSFKTLLRNNLAKHQRFSSVVVKDKHNNLKWCLRELVIEDHVIVPCLNLSTVENPNFINEYTSSLVTAPPLDPRRPLWEVHVLNVSSADAAASLVFRIHHSLGDCVSMLSLILYSTSKAAHPKALPTIPQNKASRSTGFLQIAYNVVLGLWLTFLSLLNYGATLLWKRDKTLWREENREKIGPKRLAHITFSIEDICLVRKAINGTLNDVIMGALSAGLVRYMSRRGYDKNVSVPQKMATSNDQNTRAEQRLPSNIRLRAMVAVNMRPFRMLKDLDENMQSPSKAMWGNKIAFWMFPLPMLLYGDPLQYCRVTAMVSRLKKLSFEAPLTYIIAKHMPTKLVAYVSSKLAASTTLGFSNVMGPVEEIQYVHSDTFHQLRWERKAGCISVRRINS
ncbi:wax ester synthase/diacylglycerol acyltransferase 5 isoform X2 [Cryptomeria japonica]|uniref:wax ester synthase/diacylglycerol acyltransferase 5 isoform X2 n=1 Tax=Cryptomeria japonica TaxID=3369 RepID=UPI0027DA5F45|nr:wax ester synthase/diacylglycerol acyltransferase 5 isoform X2 [Cryptomeria japonica]